MIVYFFFQAEDGIRDTSVTGVQTCALPISEGSDFGWRLQYGARCCRPDVARVSVGGEVPGKLPPMIKTGRGAPAGLLLYYDSRLPEQYQGLQFYPDVFRKLVRAYKVAPDGSTFKITNELEFLKNEDPLF